MAGARKPIWRRWLLPVAGATLLIGGVGVVIGPAAPHIIDSAADGVKVWRLGHIQVDGVTGSWLGALRAEHVAIADEEGVWLDARDLSLDWRPFDILLGAVTLDRAHARRIDILRQPNLLASRPSGNFSIDVALSNIAVETLHLDEAAFGEAGDFTATFAMDYRRKNLEAIALDLRRTDSAADRALIGYNAAALHELHVDVASPANGILARALGLGETGFEISGDGDGTAQQGAAAFSAALGPTQALTAHATWDRDNWTFAGDANLAALPYTQTITQRIGETVALQANGARVGAFTAHAETPFISADIEGALNAEHHLDGPARLVATTQRMSDIARESPFELGPARIEGELARARGSTAIRANMSATVEALGHEGALSGPIAMALTPDAFTLNGDLAADASQTDALFAQARLRADMSYDRSRGRYQLAQASFESNAGRADARGQVAHGDGEFDGQWRIRTLAALIASVDGQAEGRWRAFSETADNTRIWNASVTGRGSDLQDASNILAQTLGASPTLDARFRAESGGVTVSYARIEGARLRAGAVGRIVHGQADLSLEASARGPLTLGGAEIAGAIDATGRLTGALARPALSLDAAMSSFSAGGALIANPRLRFTLAPDGRAYAGAAEVSGTISGQPLAASSHVSIDNGAFALSNVDATLAALNARGDARVTDAGFTADLNVSGRIDGLAEGVSGAIEGEATLTPQAVQLDAAITNARAGVLHVRTATLHAEGPFNAIAATFDMQGRLRDAPLTFAGTGRLDLDGESALTLEGRGVLAESDFFTRAPIRAAWQGDQMEASLNIALGDGVVAAEWQERGRRLSGSAQINDAPLAPLAAIWGERASGRIDGAIALADRGGGLAGGANLALDDARFAGRQRGALDLRINADLDPDRLRATIDARSDEGLVAHFEANAPVTTSAAPILIALTPERSGTATWSVSGPAASLWSVARLQDQALEGQLSGAGELSFGAGRLSGDGRFELVDGRFEDKLTGITLTDLDVRIALDQRGLTIENFTASGPRGGRLTATGGSADSSHGQIAVTLDDIRVADRPDARARASGALTLSWEGLDSRLEGQLNIAEADLNIASNPQAGIPTLDVIEINRPGDEDSDEDAPAQPRRNGAATLDVRIRAPGRVYTRGRGVDAEWSLDMRLAGTATHPQVFGEARAVRGTIALSGQPFVIDDNSRITFNGDPLDARVDLTAARTTADLTAYLNLTGTARDPTISFTSDPGLPEDEILPQILFGRSVEDLSGLEAAQLAASLAALSGNGSLDLVDAARAAAGLDRFNVRQDEDGGFLVSGGVYLTRDVYVELARSGLGEAQSTVEWTVRPRLVLITSFLGNGDQRVSLRWRRESD